MFLYTSIKMKLHPIIWKVAAVLCFQTAYGQLTNQQMDSLYIAHIEERNDPPKVLHAEPLYIDLIRDLGARKGEREWNVGMGLADNLNFDSYEALIEYEWAPIDRLGLEVELPFTLYSPLGERSRDSIPSNRLESLKVAAQWTLLVDEPAALSLALGYIHEFELHSFRNWTGTGYRGNVYNPFFVAAKRWGANWHTLVYTGPRIEQSFETNAWHASYDVNTNFHYMITGTRNFIGVELNKVWYGGDFDMHIRPQMRLGISDDLMIGIVAGIPIGQREERFSTFLRLIWEPGH